jgi:hypothetical protein
MSFRGSPFGTAAGDGAWTDGATILAVALTSPSGTTTLIARLTGRGIQESAAFRRTLIILVVIYGGRSRPGPLPPRACNRKTLKSMKDQPVAANEGTGAADGESLPHRLSG